MPVVVRINRTKPGWEALQESFANDMRWQSLPWLPSAWQCAARDFDDALRSQCSALNKAYALRFQEAASLLPPLLLDVRSSDLLLDLCAAPGSKTLECLELMREDEQGLETDSGVVIANDADAERAFELLPLITRKAQHAGTAVALGSATKFPAQFDHQGKQLLYDRVLCDVPCSGDGTLRRRPHCWKSWTVDFAMTLHSKQLHILCKGLHLLRPGGRLVYSTCSLNPLENEAVVWSALARFRGDVALVRLPAAHLEAKGLKTSLGLCQWRVPSPEDPDMFFESWERVPPALRKPNGIVAQSMFCEGEDILDDFRGGCIRINPHEIDGSGFFIAVFVKSVHRAFPLSLPTNMPPLTEIVRIPWRARNENNRYEVLALDTPDVIAIKDFYGLEDMPSPLLAEYNVKGKLTQLNLVNQALLHMLRSHLNCKGSPLLVSCGVPLFKQMDDNFMTNLDVPSRWRPALEGSALLGNRMLKRVLRLDLETMQALLARRLLPMKGLQRLADKGRLSGLETCGGLLGGVVVGLRDGSFWAPCIVTGLGLELYASAEELGEPAPVLLPPVRPNVLQRGPGYVVLSKPSGLRTEDALRFALDEHPEAELVSRLDKQTSGALLIPTSVASTAALTRQFAENRVHKTYVALVHGQPEDSGEVDVPLKLAQFGGGSRYRAFAADDGKTAKTMYETAWRFVGYDDEPDFALLLVYPITGRTHQIRCHLAHIGYPLVGDNKYGGLASSWCPRLPLHCLRVQAADLLGGLLDAGAPLPADLESALDELSTMRVSPPFCWQKLLEGRSRECFSNKMKS